MSYEEPDFDDIERRMKGAVDNLKSEFSGLRSGRASTAMLDPITVEVYGAQMPINQCATISTPEPRLLSVQVWDSNNTASVEKAIRNSGLGLNPMSEGAVIRISIPELNEERRRELSKVAGKYTESAKIAIRNVRRDEMEKLKKAEKDGMSKDDHHMYGDEVQKTTDASIEAVDAAFKHKEEEIMHV
jgi:ribosome recycling factor